MPVSPDDELRLRDAATHLARVARAALAPWVRQSVARVVEHAGLDSGLVPAHALEAAALECEVRVGSDLDALLTIDVEAQRGTPLTVLRGAVVFPTALLSEAGVPPVARDPFEQATFPDDVYGLVPGGFADFGPEVHEAGLVWGAAKAYVIRHRRE